MSLKGILFRSLAAGAAMLWSAAASAVSFEGTYGVTSTPTSSANGIWIGASDIAPLSFSLAPGGSFVASSLFTVSILDNGGIDQGDDANNLGSISVAFAFTAPAAGGTGTVVGTTSGTLESDANAIQATFKIVWNAPISIAFNLGTLSVVLDNLTIVCPQTGTHDHCRPNPANPNATSWSTGVVSGTFRYEGRDDVIGQTPLPGALPLFVAGLGVIGGLTYRGRKARKLV